MDFKFIDKSVQHILDSKEPYQHQDLSVEMLIVINEFCKEHPNFHNTRHYYILLEVIKMHRRAFIYDEFMALPLYFKNIKISGKTLARQLSQCIDAVPFLFQIDSNFAKRKDDDEPFEKLVIFPNISAIVTLIAQYPNSNEKLKKILEAN